MPKWWWSWIQNVLRLSFKRQGIHWFTDDFIEKGLRIAYKERNLGDFWPCGGWYASLRQNCCASGEQSFANFDSITGTQRPIKKSFIQVAARRISWNPKRSNTRTEQSHHACVFCERFFAPVTNAWKVTGVIRLFFNTGRGKRKRNSQIKMAAR